MKLWEELEQQPEYGLLTPEDKVAVHDEWRSSILGSLADEDPEVVDAAGVTRFVAAERARSQALKTGKPFDPATAEKDYLREVTDRTAAQKQAMKDYDELERARFAVKDASARRGVTSAGDRGMPLDPRVAEILDRDRVEAQQKLDEIGSRFTPEMLQQVKEVREAEKGERPTAMLGSDLYTDPSLLLDKDKYRAAVAESGASPEAKARAMADFTEKRKQFAENSLRTLRVAGESPLPGAQDFPTWETSQPEDVRKLAPEDKALQYLREMQKRGDIRKLTSAIGTGLMQGGTDIASQGLGVAAMVANSGELAEKAAEVAEGAQTLEEVSKLEGDKQAAGATTLGGAARLVPSAAATIAPAALTGGASLGVSAALAGAQTAGAQFPNTYTELRKQGMPEQDALNAARNSAIASGIVTAGLTAAFGKTGMEAALGAGAGGKELVKSRLVAAMKGVPKGAVAEIPEELLDEMASQVIEQRTIDPEKPVSQIIDEFAETAPDLAMQIALLGGAGGAVGGYRGSTTEAAQEQEFPAAGAPPDLSQQDRDNFAQGGVPIFDTEGNVTGYTAPRAAEATASNEDIRKAAEEAIKPGTPVEVNGVTIATINPESGWTPEDVLDFANSPEDMATLARNKIITLPEVVAPIEGVDPAITAEMNARFAEGKAAGDANQTLAELERQKAAQTVDTEADIPEAQIAPTVGETAAPEVDISADTESLGVTPPPAPTLEAPEGAARNADMLRQAAARAAGTEQGPRIGFINPSVKLGLTPEESSATGAGMKEENKQTPRDTSKAERLKYLKSREVNTSGGTSLSDAEDAELAEMQSDPIAGFSRTDIEVPEFGSLSEYAKKGYMKGERVTSGVAAGFISTPDTYFVDPSQMPKGAVMDDDLRGYAYPRGDGKVGYVFMDLDGVAKVGIPPDDLAAKVIKLEKTKRVPPVTTTNETPSNAANAAGGSQGVQTEPAEGSVPTVTEDTVSISGIPSTAEIQPEVMENPTTTLDSKPSERIENAGSGVGSAEGQREMDQPSGTRYLPAQLQSTAPEVAQPKPVTNEQVQSKVEELLRAPTPVTRKPAVAFKTQTEESAFRRGFEAATKKQGEMPPPERAGLSPKDRKWDDAWRKGWASGQTFVRALPTQALEPGEESSVRTTPGEESPVISDPQAEWTPTVGEPATANINGQKVVGTVGPSTGKGLVSFQYEWNGKTQKATVRPDRLSSPVASLVEPPSYQYTQEQNTRKAGKHFPTAPGVHANHDFRKSFASMAEDTSLSRIYRQIAKVMSKMDAFANIDLHIVADGDIGYAGEYSHSNGKSSIAVNLRQVARGKVDALGTILHEALHHITLAKVRNPQGAFETEVVAKLDTIRKRVKEYAKQQGLGKRLGYELNTLEEFISALTSPDFQNFLASIPDSFSTGVSVGKFRSVLSEVFRLIAELIKGEPVARGSTMEQYFTTVLALFETPHRTLDIGKLEKLSAVQSGVAQATPGSLADNRRSLRVKVTREALTNAALSQASWKDWYQEHQDTLQRFFQDDAPLFQKILAITSQAASVKANVGLALKAYVQMKEGKPFEGFLPAVIGNLNALVAETTVNGQKIGAYMSANEGDTGAVVVDRHIARMLFGVDTPSKAQFDKASKVLTKISQEIGWTPRQVQAALWAASIVKSGKTPQSYGSYIQQLHTKGTLRERIGRFADSRSEVHGPSGPRDSDFGGSKEASGGLTAASLAEQPERRGYRTPADMLAEAAQKAKGERATEKPQGLASMFKPQAKRPATGERKLLDMPVRNTLANAYREAVRGSSTQMAPLSTVYAQARLLQPGLTPEAFLAQVQEGYDNGTLLLEGAGSQQEAGQAGLALPGTPVGTAVRMMPAPETPKSLADEGEPPIIDIGGEAEPADGPEFAFTRARFAPPKPEDQVYQVHSDEEATKKAYAWINAVGPLRAADLLMADRAPSSMDLNVKNIVMGALIKGFVDTSLDPKSSEDEKTVARATNQRLGKFRVRMNQDPARGLRQIGVQNNSVLQPIAHVLATQEVLADRGERILEKQIDGGSEGAAPRVAAAADSATAEADERLENIVRRLMGSLSPKLTATGALAKMFRGKGQRDQIIEEAAKALMLKARGNVVTPERKTALANLVSSLKSTLAANVKGDKKVAPERTLQDLLTAAFVNQVSEGDTFVAAWKEGRQKVLDMFIDMELDKEFHPAEKHLADLTSRLKHLNAGSAEQQKESTLEREQLASQIADTKERMKAAMKAVTAMTPQFEAQRDALMPPSPTMAFDPTSSKEAIGRAFEKAGYTAELDTGLDKSGKRALSVKDALLDRKRAVAAVMKVFDAEMTTSAGTQNDWPQARAVAERAVNETLGAWQAQMDEAKATRLDATKNKILGDDSKALEKLVNTLRAKIAPGSDWSDILQDLPRVQAERLAALKDRVAKHEALKNLTPEESEKLADSIDKLWQRERLKAFQDELFKAGVLKAKTSKTIANVASAAPELLRLMNLGVFNSSTFREAVSQKFGLKLMTRAQADSLSKLAAEAWEQPQGVLRNRKLKQLMEGLQHISGASWSEVVSSYWIASVLSGLNTQFNTWGAVLNGAATNLIQAGGQLLRGNGAAAIATHQQWWKALNDGMKESLHILWTGDTSMTKRFEQDIHNALDGEKGAHPIAIGERMWREGTVLQKIPGALMMMVGRSMVAADHMNNTATTQGAMAIARAMNPELYEGKSSFTQKEIDDARKQAIAETTGGVEPSTFEERRIVGVRTREILNSGLSQELRQEASLVGDQSAFQNDPTGLFGGIYQMAKNGLSKGVRHLDEVAQDEETTKVTRALAAVGAGSVYAVTGTRFMRYGFNLGNEFIRYMPGSWVLNKVAPVLGRNLSPMQQELLLGKNLVGAVALATLYAMFGDDDEEKDGEWHLEGPWDALSADEKNSRRSAGLAPNTMWKREGGKIERVGYGQWALAGLFGAAGSMLDEKRYEPAKWAERGVAGHMLRGAATGLYQLQNVAALENLAKILGGSPSSSSDKIQGPVDRLIEMGTAYTGGLVPTFLKDMDKWEDPRNFKAEGAWEKLVREMPVARRFVNDGRPQFNRIGQDVRVHREPYSRLYTSDQADTATSAYATMLARGVDFPSPSTERKIVKDGKKVPMETLGRGVTYDFEKAVATAYGKYLQENGEQLVGLPTKKLDERITKKAKDIIEIEAKKVQKKANTP